MMLFRKMNPKTPPNQGKFLQKEKGATTPKPLLYYGYTEVNRFYKILKSSVLITATTNIVRITRLCYVK
jgi:hypothetical protein